MTALGMMVSGVTREEAQAYAPVPGFAEVLRRGSLSVELYRPRGRDAQQPHERDELYEPIQILLESVRKRLSETGSSAPSLLVGEGWGGGCGQGVLEPLCPLLPPDFPDGFYVELSGTGTYRYGGEQRPFGPGDLLFAPAGVDHRFEDFSGDLEVWVIFYGPDGGERPGSRAVLGREVRE